MKNNIRARSLILFGSVAIILLFVCGGGIIFANDAIEETLPGDQWFGVREFKETLPVVLGRDATARLVGQMNIVVCRLNDFFVRAGTPYELVAFVSLDVAVNNALLTIADLPPDERAAPLQQLAVWLYSERDVFAKTGLARDAAFMARYDDKVDGIRMASEAATVTSERVHQVAVLLPSPATPIPANSSKTLVTAPRTIPLPTGFKHSFLIDGAHAKIECAKCHANGKYVGAARDCVACHHDPHNNKFGLQCATCHTTNAWKPAKRK